MKREQIVSLESVLQWGDKSQVEIDSLCIERKSHDIDIQVKEQGEPVPVSGTSWLQIVGGYFFQVPQSCRTLVTYMH